METLILLSKIALVVGCVYFGSQLAKGFIARLAAKGHIETPYDSILGGVTRWLIVIIGILFVLQLIGIPVSHVFATLSAVLVLVAVGFVAVWSVLSNILCSFLLLISRPFSFGDEIELKEPDKEKGIRGKVVNLNLFYTTLSSSGNGERAPQVARVPNTLFFQRIVICHEPSDGGNLQFGGIEEKDETQPTTK